MKKAVVIFLSLAIFGFFVLPVRSQENYTFEQAQSDYLVQLDTYTKAEADYHLAKAQYEQAGTLVSETNAKNATITLLRERDNLLVRYLIMLRERLEENEDVSGVVKSGLMTSIETEIDWFEDHASRVSSAGTLEDLVEDSAEAREHYSLFGEAVIYDVLSEFPLSKIPALRREMNQNLLQAKIINNEIRLNGDHDVSSNDRWILEVENKITRTIDKENEGRGLADVFENYGEEDSDRKETYDEIIAVSDEALQLFLDANSNMKEIIRAIRTAN